MKEIDPKITEWRKKSQHLPKFMRDFHDQKDLFKMIHELTIIEPEALNKVISWMDGHIYVIDVFLWAMARFGYTLQKTSKKLDFEDIHETIESQNGVRRQSFAGILKQSSEEKK